MNNKIKSIIESILFTWGDPVEEKDLCEVLDINNKELKNIIKDMEEIYNSESSGLRIVNINNTYQLSTKPENYEYINKFISGKNEKILSNASLETLSIIAYKQPITKLEIENIRGVKCDGTIKSLLVLNLIKISGKLDRIGKPNLYSTTDLFLKKFGISSLEKLPKLTEEKYIENNLEGI